MATYVNWENNTEIDNNVDGWDDVINAALAIDWKRQKAYQLFIGRQTIEYPSGDPLVPEVETLGFTEWDIPTKTATNYVDLSAALVSWDFDVDEVLGWWLLDDSFTRVGLGYSALLMVHTYGGGVEVRASIFRSDTGLTVLSTILTSDLLAENMQVIPFFPQDTSNDYWAVFSRNLDTGPDNISYFYVRNNSGVWNLDEVEIGASLGLTLAANEYVDEHFTGRPIGWDSSIHFEVWFARRSTAVTHNPAVDVVRFEVFNEIFTVMEKVIEWTAPAVGGVNAPWRINDLCIHMEGLNGLLPHQNDEIPTEIDPGIAANRLLVSMTELTTGEVVAAQRVYGYVVTQNEEDAPGEYTYTFQYDTNHNPAVTATATYFMSQRSQNKEIMQTFADSFQTNFLHGGYTVGLYNVLVSGTLEQHDLLCVVPGTISDLTEIAAGSDAHSIARDYQIQWRERDTHGPVFGTVAVELAGAEDEGLDRFCPGDYIPPLNKWSACLL